MGLIADGSAPGRVGRAARPSKAYREAPAPGASGWRARDRAIGRALLAMVVLGVAWRVARYAMGQPLWGDEAFIAVNLLTRDFAGLLRPLEYYQIAPVAFLWAELAVVRSFGTSEWSLRLIPFVSGLASLGLFVGLARKTLDRRSALLAVGIFAASFYPVRHSAEVKPYATDLMLSLLTTGLAWSTRLDRESPRRWLAMAGVVGVGVWFSYPLMFVGAGVGSVLAVRVATRPTRRAVALFVAFGLATSTSWLVSYLAVARPQATATSRYTDLETWRGAFPPMGEPWRLPYWLLDVHTGNMLAYPNGGNNFGSVATAAMVVAGCLALRKSRPALLAILLSPLVPTLIASGLHRYPYGTSARTTLYMAPAFCLLAGVGLVSLFRRLAGGRRRRAYRLSVVTLAAMMIVATVANVALPYKNFEDAENRRAVLELAGLARPGDRWIVYDGVETLPDSDRLMLEHWLQQMAEVRYNVLAKAPVPVEWMPDEPVIDSPPAGRTWLIVHRSGCRSFDEGRLDLWKVAIAGRLGPSRRRVERLTRGESIEAYEYPSTDRTRIVR